MRLEEVHEHVQIISIPLENSLTLPGPHQVDEEQHTQHNDDKP